MYDKVNIQPHILMIWSRMILAGPISMNYAWPYEYTLKQWFFYVRDATITSLLLCVGVYFQGVWMWNVTKVRVWLETVTKKSGYATLVECVALATQHYL